VSATLCREWGRRADAAAAAKSAGAPDAPPPPPPPSSVPPSTPAAAAAAPPAGLSADGPVIRHGRRRRRSSLHLRLPGGVAGDAAARDAPGAAAAVNAAWASAAAAVEGVEDGLRAALRKSVGAGGRLVTRGAPFDGGSRLWGTTGGGGGLGGAGAGGALRAFFEGDRPRRGSLSRVSPAATSAAWGAPVGGAGVRLDEFAAALWTAAAAAGGGAGGATWAAAALDSALGSLATGAGSCGGSSSSLGSVSGWCASGSSSGSLSSFSSSSSSSLLGAGSLRGVPIRAGGSSAELAFGVGVGLPLELNSALSAQTSAFAASMRPFVAALAAAILDAGRREAAATPPLRGSVVGGQPSSAFFGATVARTAGAPGSSVGSGLWTFWPLALPGGGASVGPHGAPPAPFLVPAGGDGTAAPVAVLSPVPGDGPDAAGSAGVSSAPPTSTAKPAPVGRRRRGVRTTAVPVVTVGTSTPGADIRAARSWTATEVVPSGGGLGGLSLLGFERSLGAGAGRGATPDMRQLFAAALAFSMYVVTRRPTVATLRRHQRRARSRQAAAASGVVAAPVPGTEVEGTGADGPPAGAVATDGGEGFVAGLTLDASVASDLRLGPRDITIVTTAGLPWMTGTAVNPLLRAVYLAREGHRVSLVIPWLENAEDQERVFPKGVFFETQEEQAEYINNWVRRELGPDGLAGVVDPPTPGAPLGDTAGAGLGFDGVVAGTTGTGASEERLFSVRFYESVYSVDFGSILPLGDITTIFGPDEVKDVCVLEEPEHLTWHHAGRMWTSVFRFVVGVVHTNYIEYARMNGFFGPSRALFLGFLNKWVCRSYCHRVIKLSDAVQPLPHSVTCNVHGVRDKFLAIGRAVAAASAAHTASLARAESIGALSLAADTDGGGASESEGDSVSVATVTSRSTWSVTSRSTWSAAGAESLDADGGVDGIDVAAPPPVEDAPPAFPLGAYFLGKVLWTKGYLPLVELLEEDYVRSGEQIKVDFFGSGPDLPAVKTRVDGSEALAGVTVHGKVIDHAAPSLHGYKLYVNPSNSDVVCTATAEALAMGKFVICLEHPSNAFFSTFANCYIYRTAEEFSELLRYCLARQPVPLSADEQFRLSWEAATQRFYEAALVPPEKARQSRVDSALAVTHKTICSNLVTPPADAWVRPRDVPPASPTTPGSLSPQVSPLGSPLASPRLSGGVGIPTATAGGAPTPGGGGGGGGGSSVPSPKLSPLLSPSTTEALRRSRNQLRRRANVILNKQRMATTPARAPAWPLRFGGSPTPPLGGGVAGPRAAAPGGTPPGGRPARAPRGAPPPPPGLTGVGGGAPEPRPPAAPERGGDVPPPPTF